jgi:hypothetical protein
VTVGEVGDVDVVVGAAGDGGAVVVGTVGDAVVVGVVGDFVSVAAGVVVAAVAAGDYFDSAAVGDAAMSPGDRKKAADGTTDSCQ